MEKSLGCPRRVGDELERWCRAACSWREGRARGDKGRGEGVQKRTSARQLARGWGDASARAGVTRLYRGRGPQRGRVGGRAAGACTSPAQPSLQPCSQPSTRQHSAKLARPRRHTPGKMRSAPPHTPPRVSEKTKPRHPEKVWHGTKNKLALLAWEPRRSRVCGIGRKEPVLMRLWNISNPERPR